MNMITRVAMAIAMGTSLLVSQSIYASGRFSQIVLPFPTSRQVTFYSRPGSNALVLEFSATTPAELTPLEHYDEKLVRRLLIRELGANGTEAQLVLRDSKVRAIVNQFSEPFRITIDLFDDGYAESRDLSSGHPQFMDLDKGVNAPAQEGLLVPAVGEQRPAGALLAQPEPKSETLGPREVANSPSRQLLKPTAEELGDSRQFASEIDGIEGGKGKYWRTYPEYIYRLQTAPFESDGDEAPSELEKATKALSSTQAMASYAGRLFNFGHESRAFFAYQQVLRREPAIFDRDALHLWKFAEIHLGQGNLTLADGYFKALMDKHPESLLSRFSALRRLDIASLRVIRDGHLRQLNALVPKLNDISVLKSAELTAQIALRRAYWNDLAMPEKFSNDHIPVTDENNARILSELHPALESQTTSFLAATIILNDLLRPERPWSKQISSFAGNYFSRYSGDVAKSHQDVLRQKFEKKFNEKLQELAAAKKFTEVVEAVKDLPKPLQKTKLSAATSWALGNSFRQMGNDAEAISQFEQTAANADDAKSKFQATLWTTILSANLAAQATRANENATFNRYNEKAAAADQNLNRLWKELSISDRHSMMAAYKEPLVATLEGEYLLRTPALLILETWKERLATRSSTQGTSDPKWESAYTPSASAVTLLRVLSERFAKLGMVPERREAIRLLQFIKPEAIEDKATKKIWADSLLTLAEDYRNTNEYLEAGRLYAFAAEKNEDWPNRAEALYKGGLLLYRAGRRDEALKAFQEASEDGQNVFYAKLAKERIERLEK